MKTVVWFREDLRTSDNPALNAACARGDVVPVFVLDETETWKPGAASRWWLHQSLSALGRKLGVLLLLRGDPRDLIPGLAHSVGADCVMWNRRYHMEGIQCDARVSSRLAALGITMRSFRGGLFAEPETVVTQGGHPYEIYTPFWRSLRNREFAAPLGPAKPKRAKIDFEGDELDDWGLISSKPNWAAGWDQIWQPGEDGARAQLRAFMKGGLDNYASLRDRPDGVHTSRLSAHLHFGEISVQQVRHAVDIATQASHLRGSEKFIDELAWREFCHHLLFHFPDLPERNWRQSFDKFKWRDSPGDLRAWQQGRTGYPLVDAGMRELWQTGWMHNRVRMIAASFLVKHLRMHWRRGEEWFWDALVDADLANNAAGWQWVAGSGADAAPYFRIFNPVLQGRKFDPEGEYVRRWCPELAKLPNAFIHAPFEAPQDVLRTAGVRLGRDYPHPIVDQREGREAAIAAYSALKAG
jgi:deoxyribodipyrimidine photo-lyase